MRMKIYVLVMVKYDFDRFQDNYFANTDKQKVIDFINHKKIDLPIFEYIQNDKIYDELNHSETFHWWIEVFEN